MLQYFFGSPDVVDIEPYVDVEKGGEVTLSDLQAFVDDIRNRTFEKKTPLFAYNHKVSPDELFTLEPKEDGSLDILAIHNSLEPTRNPSLEDKEKLSGLILALYAVKNRSLSVPPWAFQQLNPDIQRIITVPYGFKLISFKAFHESFVERVRLPPTLWQIGNNAFEKCGKLKTVELPDSLMEIGQSAFKECASLEKVTLLPNRAPKLKSIQTKTFEDCGALISVQLPAGLWAIQMDAFKNCKKLEAVELPTTLKNLYERAFSDSGLKSIILPESIQEIKHQVFLRCNSLERAAGTHVKKIEVQAFMFCFNLQKVNFPMVEKIGSHAFDGCKALKETGMMPKLKEIGPHAFYNTGFEKLELANDVETIMSNAFESCEKMTYVKLPLKLTKVYSETFLNCTALRVVDAGDTEIHAISREAFKGCISLKTVTFPKFLREIESGAFQGCSSLKTIQLPKSLKRIGKQAFESCTSLKEVTIPGGSLRYVTIEATAFRSTPYNENPRKDTTLLGTPPRITRSLASATVVILILLWYAQYRKK